MKDRDTLWPLGLFLDRGLLFSEPRGSAWLLRTGWVIRHVLQIVSEVLGEGFQNVSLTVEQATLRMLSAGPSGLEINARKGEFGFQPLDLRSRSGRRRWRRSLDVHHGGGGSGQRRNAVIVRIAGYRDAARLRALGT
jgi:hypothetical protein